MSALLKRTLRSGAVLANSARAASRALSTATDEAQQPRIERFGPVNCTVKGAAAEQGQPQKSWKDEPVPSTSVSPDVPFPGLPSNSASRGLLPPHVQETALPNGLRVVTQETYGQVATFAVFIDGGSMYENEEEIGVCHFLEACAFQSSRTRSADDILRFSTKHGISSSAVFNREVLMYKVDTLRGNADAAFSLLADAVLHASHTDAEVAQARQIIAYQRMELMGQPQALVNEHMYTAAYGEGTALGRSEKCPEARVEAVTADTLRSFKAKYFTAPRIVISAVGVDHDVAVKAASAYFGELRSRGDAGAFTGRPASSYLGGDVRSSPDWSLIPHTVAAAAAKTELTHMMIAFPTVGWSHDDVVPVCVVDTLLGGGSSFSAGGPGKGMYSRLYQQVLMSFPWVESANAFSAQLYDCGLVGTYGAATPEQAGDLVSLLGSHLARLCHEPVKPIELRRARNQLASSVMMNLETRGLLCEDIGRQILSHGKRLDPSELTRRIQAVTSDDIIRVMRQAISQPPAFAAVGDVSSLPEYDALREFFARATARFSAPPGSTFHFQPSSQRATDVR